MNFLACVRIDNKLGHAKLCEKLFRCNEIKSIICPPFFAQIIHTKFPEDCLNNGIDYIARAVSG